MISKGRTSYWATGIVVRWEGADRSAWSGYVDFLDDGWVGDNDPDTGAVSTEGRLRTRYPVSDGATVTGLRAVIDTLIADAGRLGITFLNVPFDPYLYYYADGESADSPPPPDWRELLAAEATRIGWESPYARQEAHRG